MPLQKLIPSLLCSDKQSLRYKYGPGALSIEPKFSVEISETFRVKWKGFFSSRSKLATSLVDIKKNVRFGAKMMQEHIKMEVEIIC